MEQMVLSTDMSKHKEYVDEFQVRLFTDSVCVCVCVTLVSMLLQKRAEADGLNLDVPGNRLSVLKVRHHVITW